MLIRLDMHRKNPTIPVTRLPTRNVFVESEWSVKSDISAGSSPLSSPIGANMNTPTKLDHHASAIAELSTTGRDDFIQTAWRAINKLERRP